MQNSKICFALLSGYFFFGMMQVVAQDDSLRHRNYSLFLYAGGGISYYTSSSGIPEYLKTVEQKTGPAATFRLVWQPDHRLSAGIETGWTTFFSYELVNSTIPGKLSVTGIPLLAEFSMPVYKGLRIYGGAGIYFLTSKL